MVRRAAILLLNWLVSTSQAFIRNAMQTFCGRA
jgi:hypothetical protein